jgi:2-polyprenyl-3-methyl-5-hydroxy-6-metoxy-1,4-benzoquinol methylase
VSDLIVRIIGWPATLIHGNTKVLDRWTFLKSRIPKARGTGERVLEVGCGTGGFTMGVALRGYEAVGLSWDQRNQTVAERRARVLSIGNVSFPICDVRELDGRSEFKEAFDIVICCEVIEHIMDDARLFRAMHACLRPGGRFYLTTPNLLYNSSAADIGPHSSIEDGGHVRRGYTPAMLRELCKQSGFEVEEVTEVSHVFSQLESRLQWRLTQIIGNTLTWPLMLPLRLLPPLLDGWLGKWIGSVIGWPGYCLGLSAYKRRFPVSPTMPVSVSDAVKAHG